MRHLNRRAAAVLAAAVFFCSYWTVHLAAQEPVGGLGRPERWIVEGAKTFSAEELLHALSLDLDVMAASESVNDLNRLCKLVADKIKAGYLRQGFAEVEVGARFDRDRANIVLSVKEGPRFYCGNITVDGAVSVSSPELMDWLLLEQPPEGAILAGYSQVDGKPVPQWVDQQGNSLSKNPSVWLVGEPDRLDSASEKTLHARVKQAFRELGYPWAQFTIRRTFDRENNTAQLQLEINSEGPPAFIGVVEIQGNNRDSSDDILRYLEIAPGLMVTESERTRLWYKLWMSGRYIRHSIELIPPDEVGKQAVMRIVVLESPYAPPLSEPLSEVEQALLKCRGWILAAEERGEDLELYLGNNSLRSRFTFAPKRGFITHCWSSDRDDGKGPPPSDSAAEDASQPKQSMEMALIVTDDEIQYANLGMKPKLGIPAPRGRIFSNLTLKLNHDLTSESPTLLGLGLALNSEAPDEGQSKVQLVICIEPSYVLAIPRIGEVSTSVAGDVATIVSERDTIRSTIRLKVSTGQLLLFRTEDSEEKSFGEFTVAQGVFERNQAIADRRLEGRFSASDNGFDPSQPISSVVAYVLGHNEALDFMHDRVTGAPLDEDAHRLRGVFHKLVKGGVLSPLDDVWKKWQSKSKTDNDSLFSIPDEDQDSQGLANTLIASAAKLAMASADNCFPENSWPRFLAQRMALSFSGKDTQWTQWPRGFGPVGHLAVVTLFRRLHAETARYFAASGLKQLELKDFQADYHSWLDEDKLARRVVLHLAKSIQQLDEADMKVLGETFFPEQSQVFVNFGSRLRQFREFPIETILPEALDLMWADGLKQFIEQEFKAVADVGSEQVR
jgi:hypothetical protein